MEFGKIKHTLNIWNEKSPSAIFKIDNVVYALCYDEERWYHLEADNKILMQFQDTSYLSAFEKVMEEYKNKDIEILENGKTWYEQYLKEIK